MKRHAYPFYTCNLYDIQKYSIRVTYMTYMYSLYVYMKRHAQPFYMCISYDIHVYSMCVNEKTCIPSTCSLYETICTY